jgi:hypothetical protein
VTSLPADAIRAMGAVGLAGVIVFLLDLEGLTAALVGIGTAVAAFIVSRVVTK